MYKKLAALAVVGLLASATAARADQVYSLDVAGCAGCAPSPFGQVTVTQLTADSLQVTVSLTQGTTNVGEVFANSSGNPLEFNFSGFSLTSANITSLTSGFTFGNAGGYTAPDLTSPPTSTNTFSYAIICGSACPSGSTGSANTLSFIITEGSAISYLNFTPNSPGGIYFTTDILVNGATGNVGSDGGTPTLPTPEPSSLMLLGTGIVGAAGLIRRRIAA